MSFTNLQRHWRFAAKERGLKVKTPFVLVFEDGSRIAAEVLLEGYGAPRGMIIVSEYRKIEAKKDAIIAAGYGYSCMPQPNDAGVTHLDGLDDVLADWGAAEE